MYLTTMHEFWEKVEQYNSKLITPALVLLVGVIIVELFIHIENHAVELSVKIVDGVIIAIFIVDLILLARKSRDAKYFFRNYWLDIIAVFPFVIFFNLVNSLYRAIIITERLAIGQALLHETVEVGREAKVLARGGKIARVIRIAARALRIVTKSRLFMKVHHRKRKRHRRNTQH